jgi:hypothetical protein
MYGAASAVLSLNSPSPTGTCIATSRSATAPPAERGMCPFAFAEVCVTPSNKRLKLSSSQGGGILEGQAPGAIEESMMLMKSELRARSLSADR